MLFTLTLTYFGHLDLPHWDRTTRDYSRAIFASLAHNRQLKELDGVYEKYTLLLTFLVPKTLESTISL